MTNSQRETVVQSGSGSPCQYFSELGSPKALVLFGAIALAALGCGKKADPSPSSEDTKPAAVVSSAATGSGIASASSAQPKGDTVPGGQPRRFAIGPRFPIEPGVGIGPIRFGSTVETIERQMHAKCDLVTEKLCRYVNQAVEFELEKGAAVSMTVPRPYRVTGKMNGAEPETYGLFNGAIPEDPSVGRKYGITFGVHRAGAAESLGAPKRVEKITTPNPNGTVEIQYFDGLILEFDEFPGTTEPVVGAMRVVKKG